MSEIFIHMLGLGCAGFLIHLGIVNLGYDPIHAGVTTICIIFGGCFAVLIHTMLMLMRMFLDACKSLIEEIIKS